MAALRMGAANRITEARYKKIKAEARSPKDDERLMKKYGIKQSTIRRIRNTDNFWEFRATGTTGKKEREHLKSVLVDNQEEIKEKDDDSSIDRFIAFGIVMMVWMLLIGALTVYLVVRGR